MPCGPGPLTCRYTPAVDLFRNALWSTSVSSADTDRNAPVRLLAKVLRVIRTALAAAGTSRAPSPANVKPSTTTCETPSNRSPSARVIVARPRCAEVIVMGAAAVPDWVILTDPAYVPSATTMRSPGWACATAADSVATDDA